MKRIFLLFPLSCLCFVCLSLFSSSFVYADGWIPVWIATDQYECQFRTDAEYGGSVPKFNQEQCAFLIKTEWWVTGTPTFTEAEALAWVCEGVDIGLWDVTYEDGTLVYPGASESIAQADICNTHEISAETAVVADTQTRQQTVQQVVDDVFVAPTPTLEPGEKKTGVRSTIKGKTTVLNIPVSYAINEQMKIEATLPYIRTESTDGFGDIPVMGTYRWGDFDTNLNLASVILTLPSRNMSVGGRSVMDMQVGYALVRDLKEMNRIRAVGSISYQLTQEDDQKYNPGDRLLIMGGGDVPLEGKEYSAYGILTIQNTGDGSVDGTTLNDHRQYVDLTGGIIIRKYDLRVGVTLPISTDSDFIKHEDREPSIDIGIGYKLQ